MSAITCKDCGARLEPGRIDRCDRCQRAHEDRIADRIEDMKRDVHTGGLLRDCFDALARRYQDATTADESDLAAWNEAHTRLRDLALDLSEIADLSIKSDPDRNPLGWHDAAYERRVSDQLHAWMDAQS